MTEPKPIILSIGGFDPSAGAGVLADIKTIEALGGYGMAVITANTYQNESEFDRSDWIATENILDQIRILERKHRFAAVKIGLVQNFQLVLHICRHFNKQLPIIWDPILNASAGFAFHTNVEQQLFSELLSYLTVLTPNRPEALQLFGTADSDIIGQNSLDVAVLLKGGHTKGSAADDILITASGTHVMEGKKFDAAFSKHGTGCILSSAIATKLALNCTLEQACRMAKQYVETVMKSNKSLLAYH